MRTKTFAGVVIGALGLLAYCASPTFAQWHGSGGGGFHGGSGGYHGGLGGGYYQWEEDVGQGRGNWSPMMGDFYYDYYYPSYSYGPSYGYGYPYYGGNGYSQPYYSYSNPYYGGYGQPYSQYGNNSYQSMYYSPQQYQQYGNQMMGETKTVTLSDKGFSPKHLDVKRGTLVRFTNESQKAHGLAQAQHDWKTRDLQQGQSYSWRFTEPGDYDIQDLHNPGMKITITVK